MLVGALIFAVGCGSGLLTGWFAGSVNNWGNFMANMNMPVDAIIDVQAPGTAAIDKPFDLVVTVTDTRNEARLLQDVDLDGSICDAFEVVAVDPPPNSRSASPGFLTMTFDRPLSAGATYTVTITMKPKSSGSHYGNVTAYLDNYSAVGFPVSIDVE